MIRQGNKFLNKYLIFSIIILAFFLPNLKTLEATGWPVVDVAHIAVSATNATSNTVDNTRRTIKDVIDIVARITAGVLIEHIVSSTVQWAQSGFDGNPVYATDPKQYFGNIADGIAGKYISGSDLGFLCSPFQAQVRLSLQQNYTQPRQFQCTLSNVVENIEDFYQDFNKGGWNAWFSMTQNSSNNPYGAYLEAKLELDSRIASAVELERSQLDWNQGFLGLIECTKFNPEATMPFTLNTGEVVTIPNPQHVAGKAVGECIQPGKIKTPGATIKSQLDKVLPSGVEKLVQVKHVEELLEAFAAGVIKRYVFGPKGLFDTSPGGWTAEGNTSGILPTPTGRFTQIDIDGDGIMDGMDTTGDGRPNICYFGGTNSVSGPPCLGSKEGVKFPTLPTGGSACELPQSVLDTFTLNEYSRIQSLASSSANWSACQSGSGVGCHLFVREVARDLNPSCSASGWGLLTKNPGEWQCTETQCGNLGGEGYAEDIISIVRNGTVWVIDIIGGAGAPGATLTWQVTNPGGRRDGNDWVCGGTVQAIKNSCEAGGNGGGTQPPPTTPGTPGGPVISSVSPTTVAPEATLTINGTNLSSTVRFVTSAGPATVGGASVNTTGTQVTVQVPTYLTSGPATVQNIVYNNSGIFSNTFPITIGGTTGGGSGGEATVTSVNATDGWGGTLTHNPTNNTWLVVSSGAGGTAGRIMGNNMQPVSAQFTLDPGHSGGPSVAYASDVNKYLVAWAGWGNGEIASAIYGRFVNADGTLSGDKFIIHKDSPYPHQTSTFTPKAVQYDSKNSRFVIVWSMKVGGKSDVFMSTVSSTGIVGSLVNVTGSYPIVTAAGDDGRVAPSLAINEAGNEYCIAYQRGHSTSAGQWYSWVNVARINSSTNAIGAETTVTSSFLLSNPLHVGNVAYNSTGGRYLVSYLEGGVTKGKFFTGCNGSNAGSALTINPYSSANSLAYNPQSNTFATIGQNGPNAGNTLIILDANGNRVKQEVAFGGGFGNFAPSVAANLTDGSFAATSAYQYATTRFASNISPTGGSISSNPTSTIIKYGEKNLGEGVFPDVAWMGGMLYLAVKQGNNINLYRGSRDLTDFKIYKTLPVPNADNSFPRLTVSNNVLWLAYRDGTNIQLWRSDTEAVENLGPGYGNDPVALGFGQVAWQSTPTYQIVRRNLSGGTRVNVKMGVPTGLSRILIGGDVITIDQTIYESAHRVTWGTRPWVSGDLTVAEGPNEGVVARFNNVSSTQFSLFNGNSFTPHGAGDGTGFYAITTWGNPGVRVAVVRKQ